MVPRSDNEKHLTFESDDSGVVIEGFANGRTLTRKIKAPCEGCNGIWMSELENLVKPMLLSMMRGEALPLDRKKQQALAAWFTIKSMVWDRQPQMRLQRAIYQWERDYLLKHKKPPEGWGAWIGRTDADFGECAVYSQSVVIERPDGTVLTHPTEGTRKDTVALVLFSGQFFGMTLRSPYVGSQIRLGHRYADVFRQVWPLSDATSWPPATTFPNREAASIPRLLIDALIAGINRASRS
jgi:hypothetical protein